MAALLVIVLISLSLSEEQEKSVAQGTLVAVGGGGTTVAIRRAALAATGRKTPRIVVLPQASARENAGEGSVEMWRESGARNVAIVRFDDVDAARQTIVSADVIWMPGGSQTRLFQALEKAGLSATVRAAHRAGAVVGGTSAGAAIMSDVMLARSGKDKTIGKGTAELGRGIALWPDVIVDQHFQQRGRLPRLIAAVVQHPKKIGVGIDERTAVIVRGRTFKVVGEGSATVLDARKARAANGVEGSFDGVRLAMVRAGGTYDLDAGVR